jgi:hypothetical protein
MSINGRLAVLVLLAASCGGSTFDSGTTTSGSGGSNAVGGSESGGANSTGGSTKTGGSNDTGGSSNSGGMTNSGGSSSSGGSAGGGTGGADADGGLSGLCNALYATMNTKLAEAQICVGNGLNECQGTVKGSCNCPVFVARPDSVVAQAYLTALDAYNTQCPHSCPAMPCATGIGICGATTGTGVRRCVLKSTVDGG